MIRLFLFSFLALSVIGLSLLDLLCRARDGWSIRRQDRRDLRRLR